MAVEINQATTPEDLGGAFGLVHALAEHEGSLEYLKITKEAFIEKATGDSPEIFAFIAKLDGDIVGIATGFRRLHIWNGTHLVELDDLYVVEAARGRGIGTKLLYAVGSLGKAENVPVRWMVDEDNEGAIRLYERIGAKVWIKGVCWWTPENIPG